MSVYLDSCLEYLSDIENEIEEATDLELYEKRPPKDLLGSFVEYLITGDEDHIRDVSIEEYEDEALDRWEAVEEKLLP